MVPPRAAVPPLRFLVAVIRSLLTSPSFGLQGFSFLCFTRLASSEPRRSRRICPHKASQSLQFFMARVDSCEGVAAPRTV